jgi:hypothetical protein
MPTGNPAHLLKLADREFRSLTEQRPTPQPTKKFRPMKLQYRPARPGMGSQKGSAIRYSLTPAVVIVAGLLCGGCSHSCNDMGFESFEKADRIVVKQMSKAILATITDRARISQIAQFAEAHGTDWSAPMAGTPIGTISLEFYSGGQFLGELGIGKRFLEAQGCGYFFSRRLTPEDRHAISRLVGISDALIE